MKIEDGDEESVRETHSLFPCYPFSSLLPPLFLTLLRLQGGGERGTERGTVMQNIQSFQILHVAASSLPGARIWSVVSCCAFCELRMSHGDVEIAAAEETRNHPSEAGAQRNAPLSIQETCGKEGS